MAIDSIPFVEDFDQWRDRIKNVDKRNTSYAADAVKLMELSLPYIKKTDELNTLLHATRETLRAHFMNPSDHTRSVAIEALDAFDGALDFAEPSSHADAMQLSWFSAPRK